MQKFSYQISGLACILLACIPTVALLALQFKLP